METMQSLLTEIRQCRLCVDDLPLGPRPVLNAAPQARILIIGQAPGTRVHATGIPWNDPSGDRLRDWLQLDKEQFYNQPRLAIMPMGFCYPGKGKSGDLPPRPECAPHWHARLLALMPDLKLVLLIGQYAQAYYSQSKAKTLTERVQTQNARDLYFSLPHPSPRNRRWFARNAWFEEETLPLLRERVNSALDSG